MEMGYEERGGTRCEASTRGARGPVHLRAVQGGRGGGRAHLQGVQHRRELARVAGVAVVQRERDERTEAGQHLGQQYHIRRHHCLHSQRGPPRCHPVPRPRLHPHVPETGPACRSLRSSNLLLPVFSRHRQDRCRGMVYSVRRHSNRHPGSIQAGAASPSAAHHCDHTTLAGTTRSRATPRVQARRADGMELVVVRCDRTPRATSRRLYCSRTAGG